MWWHEVVYNSTVVVTLGKKTVVGAKNWLGLRPEHVAIDLVRAWLHA